MGKKDKTLKDVLDFILYENPSTQEEIAEKLEKDFQIKVDKKKIDLKEPIKMLGVKRVDIKLFEGVIGTVKVVTKVH